MAAPISSSRAIGYMKMPPAWKKWITGFRNDMGKSSVTKLGWDSGSGRVAPVLGKVFGQHAVELDLAPEHFRVERQQHLVEQARRAVEPVLRLRLAPRHDV